METEVDLQDNELLGESTLAKLTPSPKADEVEAEGNAEKAADEPDEEEQEL